jgi:predicted SAM-dependent methyltransferase
MLRKLMKQKSFIKGHFPLLVNAAKAVVDSAKYRGSKRQVAQLLKKSSDIYIEVGAGAKAGTNGWTTIDITKNCDLFWDLRHGIPFPNASVKKIYSSHFFEHLSFQETQKFLTECRRVLVPGGTLSICVPNGRLYLEAYVKGETLDPNIFFGYKPAYNNTTRMDYVNYTAYMDGGHKYMFDEENLLYILKLSGLRNERLREFDPSLDLKARDFESIYAEADK